MPEDYDRSKFAEKPWKFCTFYCLSSSQAQFSFNKCLKLINFDLMLPASLPSALGAVPTCLPSTSQAQWPVKWSSVLVMSCCYPFHDFDTSTSTGTSTPACLQPASQLAGVHPSTPFRQLECTLRLPTEASRSLQKLPEVSRSLQEPPGGPRSPQEPPEVDLFTKHLWSAKAVMHVINAVTQV